ncbi:hypothetical protein GIB67_043125, partial [Kingdonia uniflora]
MRELVRVCEYIQDNFGRVTVPFLTAHGTSDGVTSSMSSSLLYEKASIVDKTLKLYDRMHHPLIQGEPDENADWVLEDMREWIDEKDDLPTKHKLRFGDDDREATCPRCGEEVETTTHALFFCKKIRAIWAKSYTLTPAPPIQSPTTQYIHPLPLVEEGAGHDSSRATDAEEAEAVSVICGMRAALSLGLERVILLTDCRRLVCAFESGSDDLSWRALSLTPDMLGLASLFSDFHFQHFSRSLNGEAHALAARVNSLCKLCH